MKKLLITLFLLSCSNAWAVQCTIPTVYTPSGQVTNVNLNNNFNACAAVVNGNLDNTNADTVNGFRFFETKSALPTAGNQGRVVFLTTNNTLNFDNGVAWETFTALPSTSVKGDIVYYDGTEWSKITAGTSGYPLTSAGALQTPIYSQVNLTSAVTGVLPIANGGTGVTTGIPPGLGSWQSGTSGTASTDLLVVCVVAAGSGNTLVMQTPSGSGRITVGPATDQSFSGTMPVRKGDTWSVSGSSSCYYISIGS